MGLFEKVLSSIGIGGARVDTVLLQPKVTVGGVIEGVVNITGGNLAQTINKVEIELKADYYKELDDTKIRRTATLSKIVVERNISISPNEEKRIPFTLSVPDDTPVSIHRSNVWLETELDMPTIIDPEDRDYIEITPNQTMEVVLDAMISEMGFRLREVECEANYAYSSRLGFVQEFEFVPQSAFRGVLDELELVFIPVSQGVDVRMQVDRRVRGLKSLLQEAAGLDESRTHIVISHHDAQQGSRHVAKILEQQIKSYSH